MDPYVHRIPRLILLLLALIPSLICFLLVFIFLFKTKQISSKHLHNHVILVLLISNFILITTELPITLVYSYQGDIPSQTDQFCSFWVAYNYGLYDVGLYLMAFGSIERYFLIFHERFVHQWRHIVHYPPIVVCLVYPLMFYSLMVNLYPCANTYYYDAYVCGGACFQFQLLPSTIDYITNVFSTTILIILANMILLVRVTCRKRAMRVANTWRKFRLMYLQLVSISVLYFVIWIPFVIISLIRLLYDPMFLHDATLLVINYCLYICPLVSPFVSLVGLPSVRHRMREVWTGFRGGNRVRPTGTDTIGSRRRQQQQQQQQQANPSRLYDEHAF